MTIVHRLTHRKRSRWSTCLYNKLPLLVVSSLCVAIYLTLSSLQSKLMYTDPFREPHKTIVTLARSPVALRTAGHGPAETTDNRTVLPDDCFHGLLRSVDPTCDLGEFCSEQWQQEDVLCRVFLHQAGIWPQPQQCRLTDPPTHHLHGKEEDVEVRDDEKVKDVTRDVRSKVKQVVPRLAYYVLMSESCKKPVTFIFLHYLSVLSVQRFLKPRAIYILGNCVPVGYWWSRVVNDIISVRFVRRPRPHVTEDGQVTWISHLADVVRLQVLLVNGGVYVDTDMLVLRPLDPLLQHPLTMGLVDNVTGMGNAFILAARGSRFLRDWYSSYTHFRPHHFHWNGMWEAMRLWRRDPGSVHLESEGFYSPNWFQAKELFDSAGYDLSHSYALHVWHREQSVPEGPEDILTLNTTLGHVLRYIYFGR